MGGQKIRIPVALVLALVTFPAGHARAMPPSFDCALAHQPLAATICSDPGLSSLDLSFAQVYQALRQQVGMSNMNNVRQEAIDFQRTVIQSCGLPPTLKDFNPVSAIACVTQLYVSQRDTWRNRLTGDAVEEVSLPSGNLLQAQQALRSSGYLPAQATIDGLLGPSSRIALMNFQTANNLPPSGFLSAASASKLLQASPPTARIPEAPSIRPMDPATERTNLALAQAQAETARAQAARAQAEADKARAEADAQVAINIRRAADQQAAADAAAQAKQKADDAARARQDAAGAVP